MYKVTNRGVEHLNNKRIGDEKMAEEEERELLLYEMRSFISGRVNTNQIISLITTLFSEEVEVVTKEEYENRCVKENLRYSFEVLQFEYEEEVIVLPILKYCHAGNYGFLKDKEDCTEIMITESKNSQLILEAISSYYGEFILKDDNTVRKMSVNKSGVKEVADLTFKLMKKTVSSLDKDCEIGKEQSLDVKGSLLKIKRVEAPININAAWDISFDGEFYKEVTTASLEDIVYNLLCTSL